MANSLLVKLGFSTDKDSITGTVSGIGKIDSAISDLHKKMKLTFAVGGFKLLASGVKSVVGSIKTSVTKSYDFVNELAKSGDKIAKTSRLVGLSVKDYQAFSSAAKHAGMSTEEMDNALRRFNVNLGKARSGDKTAFKMFDSILGGKNLSEFRNAPSLIGAIADSYQKLGTAEQKAFVSQELFGKSGLKMAELLSQGDEGIKKLIADFDTLGGGFSEAGAKDAEEFVDRLQEMKETVNSVKIAVATSLFPTFIDMFKEIGGYIRENRETIVPQIKSMFASFANFAKSTLPLIPPLLEKSAKIVELIGPKALMIGGVVASIVPGLMSIVGGIMAIWPLIMKIVVGVKALVAYGGAFITALKLTVAVIGGPMLGTIGLVIAAVVSFGIAIKSIYENWNLVGDAVEFVGESVKEFFSWVGSGIYSYIIDPVWNFLKELPEAFLNLWEGFKSGISNIGSMLYDAIFGGIKKAIDSARSFVKGIPILGNLFGGGEQPSVREAASGSSTSGSTPSLGSTVAKSVSETRTTTTSRFSVDFTNMPRGVQVTPPAQGDYDWSRGYVLGGF